jgi:hypothetical protein
MRGVPNDIAERVQKRRQGLLDYANAHPGCSRAALQEHLKISKPAMLRIIKEMVAMGEIRLGKVCETFTAPDGCQTAKVWRGAVFAEVQTTAPPPQQPEPVSKHPPWLTRNTNPDRPPIRNQGGQGAVRRQFTIQSSADLL